MIVLAEAFVSFLLEGVQTSPNVLKILNIQILHYYQKINKNVLLQKVVFLGPKDV
jgi:hypothetical protein